MSPELGSDSTGATFWWVIAGTLLGSVIPFTLIVILPTNKQLLNPALDRRSAETERLLALGRIARRQKRTQCCGTSAVPVPSNFHQFSDENAMLTDAPPRKLSHAGFLESDRIKTLDLPQDGQLLSIAQRIALAMSAGQVFEVRRSCAEFLAVASDFYGVPKPGVRVPAARPLRVHEGEGARGSVPLLNSAATSNLTAPSER